MREERQVKYAFVVVIAVEVLSRRHLKVDEHCFAQRYLKKLSIKLTS